MEVKFVLDFDGVLFNSAYEAYSVSQHCTLGQDEYRQDIEYDEFLAYRAVVTDAWQYNRLYHKQHYVQPDALRLTKPENHDWHFAQTFFAAREEIMRDPDWPKVMPPYDFFLRIKPMLLAHPERFAILSTRNVESLRGTLAFHGADVLQVFGQQDIRRLGNKLAVARDQGWLERDKWFVVYVDDMNSHLEPFEGQVHLPLHADWGYDHSTPGSLTDNQIITIITSLLALSKAERP